MESIHQETGVVPFPDCISVRVSDFFSRPRRSNLALLPCSMIRTKLTENGQSSKKTWSRLHGDDPCTCDDIRRRVKRSIRLTPCSDRHAGRLPTWFPSAFFGRRVVGYSSVIGSPSIICSCILIAIIPQIRVVAYTGIIDCVARAALDGVAH